MTPVYGVRGISADRGYKNFAINFSRTQFFEPHWICAGDICEFVSSGLRVYKIVSTRQSTLSKFLWILQRLIT